VLASINWSHVSLECLGPTTSVAETLSRLKGKNVGCVLITGVGGALIGIFTERDVLYKVAGLIVKTEALPIESLMTSRPIALPLRATVAHALHLMSIHGFRHIPLVDEENRPVGFISFRDIVRYLGDRYTATEKI
jgi:CBS domain-containing protein